LKRRFLVGVNGRNNAFIWGLGPEGGDPLRRVAERPEQNDYLRFFAVFHLIDVVHTKGGHEEHKGKTTGHGEEVQVVL